MPRNPLNTAVAKFRFRCVQSLTSNMAFLTQHRCLCCRFNKLLGSISIKGSEIPNFFGLANPGGLIMWCSINLWQWMVVRVCVLWIGIRISVLTESIKFCLREQQHHYSAVLNGGFERPCSYPGNSSSLSTLSCREKVSFVCLTLHLTINRWCISTLRIWNRLLIAICNRYV